MKWIWTIVLWSLCLELLLLIPFSIFYYETDEDDTFIKRVFTAL